MTNRDYLNTWSNEKLASVIGRIPEICDTMKKCEPDCVKCCLKWLERDRGDVRKIGDNYYMVVRLCENDSLLMFSDGSYRWVSNDVFLADEPSDMPADDFLKMVFRNL